MDIRDIIKKEVSFEDSNENYLQIDFDVGVKVENDLGIEDWSIENADQYQDHIDLKDFDDSKSELKVNSCTICCRMFADSYTLYQHNLSHLRVILTQSKWLYQCHYCLCYCRRKMGIRQHILTKHFMFLKRKIGSMTAPLQRCLICNKKLLYAAWHAHMTEVHGPKRYVCQICKYPFKGPRYLKRHILKVHVKPRSLQHDPVIPNKDIKCDLCPSAFSHRYNYRAHLRNCHGDNSECPLCHSKLKSRSYLLTHMKRVHYDDGKLHPCDICCKKFKSPRYLRIHKKNSHTVKIKKNKL